MSLQNFKEEFLESLLQFLWKQWSALGVAGQSESNDNWVIDPEALLLLTVSIARFDQRLFDEMLDWLVLNERFINVQRLKSIIRIEGFECTPVLNAVAGEITNRKSGLKWKSLAEQKGHVSETNNLFFLKNGKPLPVSNKKDPIFEEYGLIRNPVIHREMSTFFPEKKIQSLLLQLRGLMGVNSRSEILLYLFLNKKGTIQDIADQTYYAWRSVQDVLFEIGHSSVLNFPEAKRGRYYYIDPEPWFKILLGNDRPNIKWICWPPLFRSLELIWMKINTPGFLKLQPLEQAAEIMQLMNEKINHRLIKAGYAQYLSRISGVFGEEYLNNWVDCITEILNQ